MAGDDAGHAVRQRGKQVGAEEFECRACLLEMVDVLEDEGTRSGEEIAQLLGQPRKEEGPARDGAGPPAHQVYRPFPEVGLPAACRCDDGEQENPRVTVLGADPDPHNPVTLPP